MDGRGRGGKSGELWTGGVRRGKENLIPSYETRRCGDGAEMKVSSCDVSSLIYLLWSSFCWLTYGLIQSEIVCSKQMRQPRVFSTN